MTAPTIRFVSTVLRPVGPHEPRVYWIRRAILLAIIAIVIIVVAAECSGGGGGNKGNHGAGQPSSPTTTPSSIKPTVPPCSPVSLRLALSTDTTTYTSGQAPKLIGVFVNQSSTTCKLVRSARNEIWTVKSGPPTVWTTQGCPVSAVPKKMKIASGATKTISIFWNGRLRDSSCREGAVATAGTYVLNANLDGVSGKVAVFHIHS